MIIFSKSSAHEGVHQYAAIYSLLYSLEIQYLYLYTTINTITTTKCDDLISEDIIKSQGRNSSLKDMKRAV